MMHSRPIALCAFLAVIGASFALRAGSPLRPPPRGGALPRYRQAVERAKPRVVLLGNSLLDEGVEQDGFAELLGARTLLLTSGGSATAWWYVMLKNVICAGQQKPEVLGVCFRDTMLTRPAMRVNGHYKEIILVNAQRQEPLLRELAFEPSMGPILSAMDRYYPLYACRRELKKDLELEVQYRMVRPLFGKKIAMKSPRALRRAFSRDNLDAQLLGRRQAATEVPKDDLDFDFARAVERSLLPHMIDLARRNSVSLVLVRMKRRACASGGRESEELRAYVAGLKAYLAREKVPLIDFSYDQRIREEHYGSGDHLSRDKGRPLFSRILAEAVKPYLRQEAQELPK